jgi:hypothetical protein
MVQRRAARFVRRDYRRTTSASALIEGLGWTTLSSRRKSSRLCLFYKAFHNLSPISLDHLYSQPVQLVPLLTALVSLPYPAVLMFSNFHSSPELLLIGTLCLLINVKSHLLTLFALDFRIINSVLP